MRMPVLMLLATFAGPPALPAYADYPQPIAPPNAVLWHEFKSPTVILARCAPRDPFGLPVQVGWTADRWLRPTADGTAWQPANEPPPELVAQGETDLGIRVAAGGIRALVMECAIDNGSIVRIKKMAIVVGN